MRITVSVAILIVAVACQKAPQVGPSPYRVVGDYSYRMQVGATPVEGEFTIASDTVELDARDYSCRRLHTGLSEDILSHSFSCGGGPTAFRVVVNSKQPTLSQWSSTQLVKKEQQVCDKWTTTKEGQTVCSHTRKEIVTVAEPISGRLHVTRIAAIDKP